MWVSSMLVTRLQSPISADSVMKVCDALGDVVGNSLRIDTRAQRLFATAPLESTIPEFTDASLNSTDPTTANPPVQDLSSFLSPFVAMHEKLAT